MISEGDTQALFEALPVLGHEIPNHPLACNNASARASSADHMVAARFAAPVAQLDARKRFIVHMEEVDGKSFEYAER